ncbi:hypothetical protein [Vagococcus salmoninarum]|uniref:hypothetical protein n=1 Tax=Vagococcus salmoninarum TaxID=2739 RepID=UPI00187ED071|nr:hypothetical protein [Vagococcus salmoninarum]MBE9388198.1 hypothetical protein [Vagococcus salmoninarum]
MSDYKYSVKNTSKIEREKLRNVALSYSTLDASEPSEDTMKLVDEYVVGNIEIAEALEMVIEKYQTMPLISLI